MEDGFSVATRLRARTRRIEEDERFEIAQAILDREPKRFDGLEPSLASWLIRIEAKLDCMLAAMGMPQEEAPLLGDPVDITLGEQGAIVPLDEPASVGDRVLIELELPGPPPHSLMALGRITELGPGEVAVRFEVLHEDDHAAIVSHSLSVQRRVLRQRSGIDGEPA